ncbi:MAG: AI-2E family transporter [Bacteroidota bacterium]
MHLRNTANFLIASIAIVVILTFGQNLIVPFVFAVLLWFIVRELKELLNKVKFVRERFPSWTKTLITSIFILFILGIISQIISTNIQTLAKSYDKYEKNVDLLIQNANGILDIDLMEFLTNHIGNFNFGGLLSSIFASLAEILGNTFIILIYFLFIFLEESHFETKLRKVFSKNNRYHKVSEILERIERSIAKYFGLKTVVSLITGILSYIVLFFIGIDSPAFWAFLIFILNFIPTIGSLIATVFPAIFCLLQFGEFGPGILVLILVGAVQVLVGNVLEPRLMGNSMNVSALVTILALSFWGALWGVTGMILSIPITVIMIIVLSQFPSTQPIAIMLSDKGELETLNINNPDPK